MFLSHVAIFTFTSLFSNHFDCAFHVRLHPSANYPPPPYHLVFPCFACLLLHRRSLISAFQSTINPISIDKHLSTYTRVQSYFPIFSRRRLTKSFDEISRIFVDLIIISHAYIQHRPPATRNMRARCCSTGEPPRSNSTLVHHTGEREVGR